MKTAKEVLTSYSDGSCAQFMGCENILKAMKEYSRQQISAYIRATKSKRICSSSVAYKKCYLWPSLEGGCSNCPKYDGK